MPTSRNDKCGMERTCARMRRLLSADLDGEATQAESTLAHDHVMRCEECAAWLERVQRTTRRARLRSAEPTPDLTAGVLDRLARVDRRRRLQGSVLRTMLVSLGLVQLEWAIAGLVHDHTHVSREMVAFDVAVALGVLAVALRPWRAAGLLPVLGVLAALLAVTSTLDLLDGRTTFYRELPHLLVVAELAVVWRIRWVAGPVGVLPPTTSGTTVRAERRRAA